MPTLRSRASTSLTRAPSNAMSPPVGLVDAREHQQRGRLAAARGAEHRYEGAVLDREIDAARPLESRRPIPCDVLELRYAPSLTPGCRRSSSASDISGRRHREEGSAARRTPTTAATMP